MSRTWSFVACILAGFILLMWMTVPLYLQWQLNPVESHKPYTVSPQAQQLHASLFIGDGHAESMLGSRDMTQEPSYGQLDLPRMQQGNITLQVFTTVTKSPSGLN